MGRVLLKSSLALAALATLASLGGAGRVHAAEPVVDRSRSSLVQEWVGLELSPLSLNSGSSPGQALTRFQPGPGGTLRLLRHRWTRAYWTPLQAGLFVGEAGAGTIFAHVDMEGGGIISLGPRTALEFGLAAGVGILAIRYATSGCDGSCNVGGAGVMLSPVARYLFRHGPGWTMGATARAVIPLQVPSGDWFGYFNGRAVLYLVGFDLALGAR